MLGINFLLVISQLVIFCWIAAGKTSEEIFGYVLLLIISEFRSLLPALKKEWKENRKKDDEIYEAEKDKRKGLK